jgi:hypothetical protein
VSRWRSTGQDSEELEIGRREQGAGSDEERGVRVLTMTTPLLIVVSLPRARAVWCLSTQILEQCGGEDRKKKKSQKKKGVGQSDKSISFNILWISAEKSTQTRWQPK